MGKEKIRICKKCSGLDVGRLKEKYGDQTVSKGCIGKCLHRSPELRGTCYGYINHQFEITLNEKDFMTKIDDALK